MTIPATSRGTRRGRGASCPLSCSDQLQALDELLVLPGLCHENAEAAAFQPPLQHSPANAASATEDARKRDSQRVALEGIGQNDPVGKEVEQKLQ